MANDRRLRVSHQYHDVRGNVFLSVMYMNIRAPRTRKEVDAINDYLRDFHRTPEVHVHGWNEVEMTDDPGETSAYEAALAEQVRVG